jgi:hypothetical protein
MYKKRGLSRGELEDECKWISYINEVKKELERISKKV